MSEDQPKCPVNHSTRASWTLLLWKSPASAQEAPQASTSQVSASEQPKCPVDHNTRADWLKKVSVTASVPDAIEEDATTCTSDKLEASSSLNPHTNVDLPTDRVISSIPRTSADANWIYPSEKQFYEAMMRKNWNPRAEDMHTVVPIHNMVNERTWNHILNWERAIYQEALNKCGGIKLTSFQGNPQKLTPRAWVRTYLFGMEKPFDRHDWVINRCGVEVEYVIDFYAGDEKNPNVFLDVRPKLNSWEGVRLRASRAFGFS